MVGKGLGFAAGVSVLALSVAASGVAWAAPKNCALPDERTAIQAAAVQQELMVAALTCKDIPRYNAFVTGFQKELQASDRNLQKFFKRLYGSRQGTEEYHAYKTRLANAASRRSLSGIAEFCAGAAIVFDAALSTIQPSLATFVSAREIEDGGPFGACEMRVAVGFPADAAPQMAAIPRPKPLADVMPAQGTGLTATRQQPQSATN